MPLAMPKETRHRTKQEFVYSTLRDSIMKCELHPGERLVIDDLARRLSVSSIPVREALQILQSEGLVVTVPHVGATVAPISRESILEVFTIMEGLEMVATRVAAERATSADIEELTQIVGGMDRVLTAGLHEMWADLNTRFHLTISRLTDMPMLHEMMESALGRWDRVRRFYFNGVLLHRLEQAQQEHHSILTAIQNRDLPGLERTIREHNRGALASYNTFLQSTQPQS
jgi:DNA-binding GntR family transcriptional regulator